MKLLLELLKINEAKKKKSKVLGSMRQKVYHADYTRTKDEPYRQYDKHEEHKSER